jgi:hypothetical protein
VPRFRLFLPTQQSCDGLDGKEMGSFCAEEWDGVTVLDCWSRLRSFCGELWIEVGEDVLEVERLEILWLLRSRGVP